MSGLTASQLTSHTVQTNGVQVAVNLECGLTRLRRTRGRALLQDSAETRVSSLEKGHLEALSLIPEHSDTENVPTTYL